jgi:glyoxylate/hydroxypyruvate reductase A
MGAILVFSPDRAEADAYRRLVADALPGEEVLWSSDLADAAGKIAAAEILLGWRFPPGLLGHGSRLRWIHKVSAGVEDVVAAPDLPSGLRLTRTGGEVIAQRMVEYVLGAIFATTQRFHRAFRQAQESRWESYPVRRARGMTAGVAGLGDIGRSIARGLNANGMTVDGWRRSQGPVDAPLRRLHVGHAALLDFASACDFIVSVLPATRETDHVFSAGVFQAMRATAVLINVGRGNSVDEQALISAVRTRQIAGAFLDVVSEEPLPPENPLWRVENIVITPHVSGPIVPEEVFPDFLENYARFRDGRELLKEIDLNRGY